MSMIIPSIRSIMFTRINRRIRLDVSPSMNWVTIAGILRYARKYPNALEDPIRNITMATVFTESKRSFGKSERGISL